MEGSGTGFNVLSAYNDWGQANTIGGTADSIWEDMTVPGSNSGFYANTATTTLHPVDDVTNGIHHRLPDSTSLLNDLAQFRAVRVNPPMDMAAGVTDVKLFRVSCWGARRNAAAHFKGMHIGSSIGSVPATATETELVTLFPTVTRQSFTIKYDLPEAGEVYFTVFDLLGRIIDQKTATETKGMHQTMFTVNGYANGSYFLNFRAGTLSETKRFIVVH